MICVAVVLAAGTAVAKEESNKEKLIGVWEITKGTAVPQGGTVEFTKDGKMKMTAEVRGKKQTMEAKYVVDGDKFTMTLLGPNGKPLAGPDGKEFKETITITKLTDKVLVTKDPKGEVAEFKKKKKE
jgi:uncharacterized protein (TIGR03066 family)